jgi:hypothetical protein
VTRKSRVLFQVKSKIFFQFPHPKASANDGQSIQIRDCVLKPMRSGPSDGLIHAVYCPDELAAEMVNSNQDGRATFRHGGCIN